MAKNGNILALETSTDRGSVALLDSEGEVLFYEEFVSARDHNILIFEPLSRLLAVGEFGRMVVGTGPGSYSGVRVALAAAQGIGAVHEVPVHGVESILGCDLPAGVGRVIGDARRGEWYSIEVLDGMPVGEAELTGREEFADRPEAWRAQGAWVASLEGARKLERTFGELGGEIPVIEPRADVLGKAWLGMDEGARERYAAKVVEPYYLRPPHITPAKGGHPLR